MKYYMIYGKLPNMNKYQAVDLSNGTFTNRLIYATFFYENELEKAKKVIEDLKKMNKGSDFKIVEKK